MNSDGIARPNPALTPGAAVPGVSVEQVCAPGYASTSRNPGLLDEQSVFQLYLLDYPASLSGYRVDPLIPTELGGADTLPNLWPEPTTPQTAGRKDQLAGWPAGYTSWSAPMRFRWRPLSARSPTTGTPLGCVTAARTRPRPTRSRRWAPRARTRRQHSAHRPVRLPWVRPRRPWPEGLRPLAPRRCRPQPGPRLSELSPHHLARPPR